VARNGVSKIPSSVNEIYIPLWIQNAVTASSISTTDPCLLQIGTTGMVGATTGNAVKLHTLSNQWSPAQQFSFECVFHTGNAVGLVCTVSLWDFTAGAIISQSSLVLNSPQNTLFVTMRSPKFNLVPGRVYGVSGRTSSSSYAPYITKASLIAHLK
jgi:hypothetical protein